MTKSLVLLSAILAGPLGAAPSLTCNIRDYGATSDPAQLATRAIQAAIDACAAKGGGIVVVPPGEFTSGAVRLKDNIELRIEAGATVVPSQTKQDYPDGVLALVYSDGAKNIALTGRGKLDGRARYKYAESAVFDNMIPDEIAIARAAGVDMRRYQHAGLTTNLVRLMNSTDVFVEDVSLVNSQFWTLHLQNCDRVRIHAVYLYSDPEKAINADGIDVVSSRNVVISDSFVTTADDAICLKTDAGTPTENVTVTNCVLSSSSCAFKIGSRTRADVRHVTFSNSVIRDTNRGFGIQDPVDGVVSDILVSNVTMELRRRDWYWWGSAEPISITINRRPPLQTLGRIRDIVIQNVLAHGRGTSRITGLADRTIESVTLRNVVLDMAPENTKDKRAMDALLIRNVDECRLQDVRVRWAQKEFEPKWASALHATNVDTLEVDGLEGTQGRPEASEVPAVLLENVRSGTVRHCVAPEGTGTFFEVHGGGLRFEENDTGRARRGFVRP